jgi:hypothetical protein
MGNTQVEQNKEHFISEARRNGAVLVREVFRDRQGRLKWIGGGVIYQSRRDAEMEFGPMTGAPRDGGRP